MIRHAIAALAVIALASGCVVTDSRPPAPDHPLMVQAETRMLAGDEEGALQAYRSFRESIRSSPLESECHYREGTILLKQGRLAEAERSFTAAAARPRSPYIEQGAWIGLGDVRFASDDYRSAADRYQRALDLRVPDGRTDYALYRLGVARQRLGEWDAGHACYQLLVRDHGKSPLVARAEQRMSATDRALHFQVGAFQAEESAKALERRMRQEGLIAKTVNVQGGAAPYLVWVGDYRSYADARAALPKVQALCADAVLVP